MSQTLQSTRSRLSHRSELSRLLALLTEYEYVDKL